MDIKKVIKNHGWTLQKLAAEMRGKNGEKGISQPSVSSIINGNPTIDKLQEIADIMGITVSELVADHQSDLVVTCDKCGNVMKFKRVEQ